MFINGKDHIDRYFPIAEDKKVLPEHLMTIEMFLLFKGYFPEMNFYTEYEEWEIIE